MAEPYLPERIAVDAAGFYWRVVSDEMWSMCLTNPDNSPIPEPVTFYVRDGGNRAEPNHYEWFMPDPLKWGEEYLDDFEAKMREALTDPYVHDMAQSVLPLIALARAGMKP